MNREVIIALDFPNQHRTFDFLDRLEAKEVFVKVGMELYYREGNEILKKIKDRGHKIFLDLKLHDIPNTVGKAMKSLSAQDVDIVNVHAAGGIDMMRAAVEGLGSRNNRRPKLIAVTILTSLDEKRISQELLIDKKLEDTVLHYAQNAKKAGLDGVVCSALESMKIIEACGENFLTVTPGIRLEGDEKADQNRVVTPARAREAGSAHIVVGRSVTEASNPKEAYERCIKEFQGI